MADITEVLEKLIQRTKDGKVLWKPTAVEQTFVAVVGNNSAMISRDVSVTALKILNSTGAEIETLNSGFSLDKELETALIQLHQQARRTALGVEETLDEVLKELEKVE